MIKKYIKIYLAAILLMMAAHCSKKTFHADIQPNTDFYALKIFATLNVINENFTPNTGAVHTQISLTNSSFVHYQHSRKSGSRNHKTIYTGYTRLVEAEGNSISSDLSVAALAMEYFDKLGPYNTSPQKISMNKLGVLATNTSYSSLSGTHQDGIPAQISDHQFFTTETGEVPSINSTITNGVFYPKTIGVTTPPAPISLAYFPQGAFQGNIPSYALNSTGVAETRIFLEVNNAPKPHTDLSALVKVYGTYSPSKDEVTGTIEDDNYEYGTFTIQDASKNISTLSFEIFATPAHK